MAKQPSISTSAFPALEDFGKLQARYEPLSLAKRAAAVLHDAEPAVATCEQLLAELAEHPKAGQVFAVIRGNPILVGKMRASEAKNTLLDSSNDFIVATLHKLSSWRKTLSRIAAGEGIAKENGKEHIPSDAPVALALFSVNALESYLSVIQLALGELAKIDDKGATHHQSNIAKIRRCATLISDYDHASALRAVIH